MSSHSTTFGSDGDMRGDAADVGVPGTAASGHLSPPPPGQKTALHVRHRRPRLERILTDMRHPLRPFYPCPHPRAAASPHPAFPATFLHYFLLTEAQLDSMATYYHQRPSGPRSPSNFWRGAYPAEMRWDDEWLEHVGRAWGEGEGEGAGEGALRRARIKRRKFGRFIGIRWCETPTDEAEEYERWLRVRAESRLKTDDLAFWGRRGWRT